MLDSPKPVLVALPAFVSLAAACTVYVMMAGALATRLKANGVTACVVSAVASGFLFPVKFLVPDMRVFWLAEGDNAALMPVLAGILLSVLWLMVGCISFEGKELE